MARRPFTYSVADASSCHGALSFDDRDLGLNNQLASLSYMLCTANVTRACSLYAPPLGYIPCGVHLPGNRTRKSCKIPNEKAAVDVRRLLRLPPDVEALLERGAAAANATGPTSYGSGRCRRGEVGPSCDICGPYGLNPYRCATQAFARQARVHMIYAYGLKYHLKSKKSPEKPNCPLLQLELAPQVEAYARALMARLGLTAGNYVAAQYRTGWAWRVHTRKLNHEWACYGLRTINASLAKQSRLRGGELLSRPLFLLTNSRNLHTNGIPVPVQVLFAWAFRIQGARPR